jgi:hypothetical protein
MQGPTGATSESEDRESFDPFEAIEQFEDSLPR